uniref:C2H2-type domain-containing protein n=1 Tax=Romanomermis culicivorax TaxID=13658 RepID=A0A915IIS7_ROMCU
MYGNKFSASDRKNVVDVDTLKDLMKIFCINLPWTKIETSIFRRRKRNKKKILELRDSLKDLVAENTISTQAVSTNCATRKISRMVNGPQNRLNQVCNDRILIHQATDQSEVILSDNDVPPKELECSSSNLVENLVIDGHFSVLSSPTATTDPSFGVEETFFHRCDNCESKFDCLWDLYEHLSNVHGYKELTCQICGENVSGLLSEFQTHWNSHVVTASDNDFSTPGTSNNKSVDKAAVLNNKSEEKRHKCSLCGASFLYESYLKRHCQRQHDILQKTLKPFVCCHCGHATREKCALEVHIKSKHTKIK